MERFDKLKMLALDTEAMPWEEHPEPKVGRSFFSKTLMQDPDTGMGIKLIKYPAGYMTPWHDHPCSHGIYVLEGTVKTHEGCYGPGSFIWSPEGSLAEHGAAAGEDVVILFITNK